MAVDRGFPASIVQAPTRLADPDNVRNFGKKPDTLQSPWEYHAAFP